ncbi:phage major capsid protein [Mycobacterium attenuatum]|uniref:phage major capsid protein n=1 Tax=Mycobacterium attenuatum TaxID=2341086 RepID=UPI000F029D32|nr:phage major capsid protein [Mycobacterium attenuatum]VBA60291.1 hypothetical protein LAUMK41_03925 [Mycobacterium attenuatum]
MTNTDVESMTYEQARAAAQQILDNAGSDLVGPDAERVRALTVHAQNLREQERQRDRQHANDLTALVRGLQSGALRTEGGANGMHTLNGEQRSPYDEDRPAVNRERDAAMRVLDRNVKDGLMQARGAEVIDRLITTGAPQARSWTSRWAAIAGDQNYLRAFARMVADPVNGASLFTPAESHAWRTAAQVQAERAMNSVDVTGGFLIPAQLDPAVLLSSTGSTNPLRSMARIAQTVGDAWRGVSSDGVVAHWYSEAEEVSDDSPSLAQPEVPTYRGSAWVPFSIELEGDGAGFVAEIGRLMLDAIEQLTAAAYVGGTGTGEPTGFIPALTGTSTYTVNGAGSETVASADPYALQSALPPRFQANSAFAANLTTINVLRQAETAAGALKFPELAADRLCGRRMWEVSNMDTVNAAVTATSYPLVLGDWSQFLITDRVGSTVELVPHVFGAGRRPTGQRGFFAWFRTGSDVLVDNAFRVLKVQTTA